MNDTLSQDYDKLVQRIVSILTTNLWRLINKEQHYAGNLEQGTVGLTAPLKVLNVLMSAPKVMIIKILVLFLLMGQFN